MLKKTLVWLVPLWFSAGARASPGQLALATAEHARAGYHGRVFDTPAEMVNFNTVAQDGVPCERNTRHVTPAHVRGGARRIARIMAGVA